MKVLLINGSSNLAGSTFTALSEVADTLEAEGVQTEIFQLGASLSGTAAAAAAAPVCRETPACSRMTASTS